MLTTEQSETEELSGELGDQGGAHLEELHGVVASDGALLHLHQGGLVHAGVDLHGLTLLLHQRFEVQEVALVVHLVQLQRHLHILRIGRVSSHLEDGR